MNRMSATITFSNGEYANLIDGEVHRFSRNISVKQILYVRDVLKIKIGVEALFDVDAACEREDKPGVMIWTIQMALRQAEADDDDELRDVAEMLLRKGTKYEKLNEPEF